MLHSNNIAFISAFASDEYNTQEILFMLLTRTLFLNDSEYAYIIKFTVYCILIMQYVAF